MVWLPRNAQKCIFFTPFSPFLAKKNFFSKIRLRQFFGTIESYLDAKNQKKLWSGSSGIHPDGRTDVRGHIYRTSQILGGGPKTKDINRRGDIPSASIRFPSAFRPLCGRTSPRTWTDRGRTAHGPVSYTHLTLPTTSPV